ncbi:MAG: TetR/AcrR family transcriptional regulator [Verrucomicrobiota bacterium]
MATKNDSPQRILKAAVREFASRGFSGARVDDIALRARTNKQLIYYYYKNKEKLYEEVLRAVHAKVEKWIEASPDDPAENFKFWLGVHAKDSSYVHLMIWEGLELKGKRIPAESKRREFYKKSIEKIKKNIGPNFWPKSLDPEQALLTWICMVVTPFALPQICLLITGKKPTNAEFLEDRSAFFESLANILKDTGSK